MDIVQYAVAAIGAIALMPLVATAIGGINKSRRERRRAAMFDRFNNRIGGDY